MTDRQWENYASFRNSRKAVIYSGTSIQLPWQMFASEQTIPAIN